MKQDGQPPLAVMIAAVGLAVITITILCNLHRLGPGLPERLNLERLSHAPGPQITIVAIGTSKSRHGIHFDSAMSEALSQAGISANFYRITHSSATIRQLRPALDHLTQNPPDLLLLESDLLIFEPWGKNRRIQWNLQLKKNVRKIIDLLRKKNITKENYGIIAFKKAELCIKEKPSLLKRFEKNVETRKVSSESERADYHDYLMPMVEQGTHVVLLELPRSPAANAFFPQKLRVEASRLRTRYADMPGFSNWKPPPLLLPEIDYCDHGHLRESGREKFSQWLVTQIANSPFSHKGLSDD